MAVAGYLTYDTKIDRSGFEKGLNSLKGTTKTVGGQIKSIVTALGIDKLISATFSILNSSIDGAISRLDTLNNFPKVMSNLGIETEQSSKAMEKLSNGLQGIPTALDDAALSVQRFTSKNGDVDKSVDLFLAVNNALLAGGASMEIQSTAMEQLSQAYSKGKPDMMEWRSIQTAMPAQLKQISKAMLGNKDSLESYLKKAKEFAKQNPLNSTAKELVEQLEEIKKGSGDMTTALGTALRSGVISMDDFLNTIVKLNKEGTGEFLSFEEQAKNSTGGIKTSITNAKTAITRGVANIIDSIDKALKKTKAQGIGNLISQLGKTAEKVLKNIANSISKIDINKVINKVITTFKKLLPIIISVTSALVAYKTTLALITAIQIAKNIIGTVSAFLQLIPAIRSAKDAYLLLNMAMNANPVGLAVAGITALTAALGYLALRQTDAQKNAKALAKEMSDAKQSFDDFNQSVDENRDKSLSQINTAEALKDQLSKLVDENGKVKEGYQDRVNFILGQLNDALGTEYKLNGDIIEQYQKMQGEIDSIIEKKKAQIILEAEGQKWAEWVKNHAQAVENFKKAQDELGMSYSEAESKLQEYNTTLMYARDLDTLTLGTITKGKEALENKMEAYRKADDVVREGVELENSYQQMLVDYTNENYSAIAETVNVKTRDWTNFSTTELLKSLDQQEQDLADYRNAYALHHDELERKNMEAAEKNVANLKGLIAERTGIRQEAFAEEIPEWGDLGQKSSDMFGQNIQKIQGNTNEALQKTESAIHSDKKVQDAMVQLAKETDEGYNNNVDGKTWGWDLVSNIAKGISNGDGIISSAASGIAGIVKSIIGHSVPSVGPLKDELTYMPDMIDNLVKGINDNKYKVQKATNLLAQDINKSLGNIANKDLNDSIISKMQSAVALETGRINATASVKSNNSMLNVINLNAKIDGSVEIDKQKAGRLLAPSVSKTLRTAGV